MAILKDLIVNGVVRHISDSYFATIKSGTWNGSTITVPYGGTGLNSLSSASAGQCLVVNSDKTGFTFATKDNSGNTWNANSTTVAGYVPASGTVAYKVYASNTNANASWQDLWKATNSVVGGFKLSTAADTSAVTLGASTNYTATGNNRNYPVKLDSNGIAYVNIPWRNDTYTIPSSLPANGGTAAKLSDATFYGTTPDKFTIVDSNNLGTCSFGYKGRIIKSTYNSENLAGGQYGFPAGDNANALIYIGTHEGSGTAGNSYGHQLGFSSNHRIYHRATSNSLFTTSWNKIAYTSEIPTKYSDLSGDTLLINPNNVEGYIGIAKTSTNAGSIYLLSQNSTTGVRGLYTANSSNIAKVIINIDKDNNSYFNGTCDYAQAASSGTQYSMFAFKSTWNDRIIGQIYSDCGANGSWGTNGGRLVFRSYCGPVGTTNEKTYYLDCCLPWTTTLSRDTQGYICVTNIGTINGNLTISGSYYANSDIRYKNIIEHKTFTAEEIANLPIFTYKWNNKEDNNIYIGSSAQDAELLAKEFISVENDGTKSLDYAKLGALSSIALAREVVKLKLKIKELEGRLNG